MQAAAHAAGKPHDVVISRSRHPQAAAHILLEPLFEQLPLGLLWLVMIFLGLGLVLAIFRGLSTSLIGERATSRMLGELAADFVRACLRAPFTVLGGLLRLLWRAARRH